MHLSRDDKEKREDLVADRVLAGFTFSYLRKYKKLISIAILLIVIGTVISLIPLLLIEKVFDEDLANDDRSGLLTSMLVMVIAYILTWVIQFIRIVIIAKVGQSSVYQLRNDMFNKLQNQSQEYFDRSQSGKINSRMTNDVDTISEFLGSGIVEVIASGFELIGIVALMLYLDIKLSLISFLIIPFLLLLSWFFRGPVRRVATKTRVTIAKVTSNLSENISGAKESKTFGREKENQRQFDQVNKENYQASMKAQTLFALIFPFISIIAAVGIMAVLWFAGYQAAVVGDTKYSVGLITAFMLLIQRFFRPIFTLSMFYSVFQSALASMERIYLFMNEPIKVEDSKDAKEIKIINGDIAFDKVNFSYDKKVPIFEDLSLGVQGKKSIALVGHTGAGKTTFIRMIMRFYDVDQGEIFIDGQNIKDVSLSSLRKIIGFVPQEPVLFNGTILDNIKYGNPEVLIDEVYDACRLVGIHDFIMDLPEQYETIVRERGKRLSMGQRQLISFTRALIVNPSVLILDEATSSLDPIAEIRIQQALEKLLVDRTSIIIAHRLSTIRKADRIIVLENGKIIQDGTHKELVFTKGKYQELYLNQFIYKKDGGETEDPGDTKHEMMKKHKKMMKIKKTHPMHGD